MGASDYIVGNAPQSVSYAAPLLDFSPIAKLPDEYFKGTQQGRTRALQTAFKDGLPTNPDGSPNVNAIINTGVKLGGADYAAGLIPMLLAAQAGKQGQENIRSIDSDVNGPGAAPAAGGVSAPPPGPSTSNPSGAGPGNLRSPQGTVPQQPVPPQPKLSSVGTDNNGSDTVRSVATEIFGGREVGTLIPRFASALKVDPDAPLTADQVGQIKSIMGRTKLAQAGMGGQPPQAATGSDAAISQQPGTVTPADRANNGSPPAPMAPPAAPGAPGAAPGAVAVAPPGAGGGAPFAPTAPAAPAAPVVSPPAVASVQRAADPSAGLVPAGVDPRGFADRLRQGAMRARASAIAIAGYKPEMAAQYEKQAEAYDTRAKLIDESISKSGELTNDEKAYRLYRQQGGKLPFQNWVATTEGEKKQAQVNAENTAMTPEQKAHAQYQREGGTLPFQQWMATTEGQKKAAQVAAENQALTPEQKNARDHSVLAFEREKEGQKLDTERYGKLETGITTAAEAADLERPKLALLKQAMNDPDYWSGAGNNAVLAYKRAIAGLDPSRANAAQPMELGTKIASDQALASIKALASGGGVGPIRVAEMKLIEKANYSPNNTPATNRTLVEISDRSFKRVAEINQLKTAYLNGQLDGQPHTRLDRNFDQVVQHYRETNPLFSSAELKDPRLIGAPTVTPDQVRLVPKGQPYYTTDGRLGMGR